MTEVEYNIDQLLSALKTPFAEVPEINFPKLDPSLDPRSSYLGILDGLRGDFAEAMEGKASEVSGRILSALRGFCGLLNDELVVDPKAKYAHSYLDALITLTEEQLSSKGITFDADTYTPTRERIQRSFANGRVEEARWSETPAPATRGEVTRITFIDSRGRIHGEQLNDLSDVILFVRDLTQGRTVLAPEMRTSGPLMTTQIRTNNREILTLEQFARLMANEREWTMHRLQTLDVRGDEGEWLREYIR